MDLTSGEASNRQAEVPQPSESFPRQPLPGYGDEAWKVCMQAAVRALSLAPLLTLPGHRLSMIALMGCSHEWGPPPSTTLKFAPLPS